MGIKNKNIIILGIGRFQEDFEYMFKGFNVKGYITLDNKEIKTYNSKTCYNIEDINKNLLKGLLIVVCYRKDNKIYEALNKINLKENKDFIFIEDMSYLLDDKKDIIIDQIKYYNNIYIKRNKNYISPYIKNSDLFKKMIYTDSYDGIDCRFPFEYVNIQPNGEIYSCCESWGYHDIGNLFIKSPFEIWNSTSAKLHRLAIINKTYCFCDKTLCPYLNQDMEKTDTRFKLKQAEVIPQDIYVSIDRSCNLHCKSCRNEHFNAKGLRLKQVEILYNKLNKSTWLSDSKHLVLAGQGEVFYSKIYQKMLFDSNLVKRDNIEILTNGTLLNKQKLDKMCSIYKDIKIYITMDAVNEDTYKNIRLGGNFKALMDNLKYMCEKKKEGKIKQIELFFIVQRKNYKEMIRFVKMAKELGVDRVSFSQLSNWGTFTEKEFKKASMMDENGKPKVELKKILKNQIFKDSIVNHTNITKFVD